MNLALTTGPIAVWILLLGLFLPRLTLLVAWVLSVYPPNPLADVVNFLGWLFIPRFLIAFYIYTDSGTNNVWFWAYIITGVVGLLGESGLVHRRVVRRRTIVSQDGRTTTTVEEEEV
jgi:hypothetical protein